MSTATFFKAIGFNDSAIAEAKQYFGYFALVGNQAMDTFAALENYRLREKLDKWLKQRSLAQILDWFDCIETTNVRTAMGNYRWSTESVARDRLFLERLGVTGK